MRLNDKVVIITGATTGIGCATAKRFAIEGAILILVARTKKKLEVLSTELQGLGARVVIKQVDVTIPEELDEMIHQVFLAHNRIDILINNAGVGLIAPIESSHENLIRRMFETNFFAPLRASRNVIPLMRGQGGGQIVNISSILGLVSLPGLTAYSATKFALNALTDGLRTEVAEDGIELISICPGRVNTPFKNNLLQNKFKEKHWGGISEIGWRRKSSPHALNERSW